MKRIIVAAAFATGACAGPQVGPSQQFAGGEGMIVEECVIVPGAAGGMAGDSIAKGAILGEVCEERFVPASGTPAPLVAFGSGDQETDPQPDPTGTPRPEEPTPDPGDTDPGDTDPGKPDPGKPDPGTPDPGKPDCPCPGGDGAGGHDDGGKDEAGDGGKDGDRKAAIRPRTGHYT